MEKNEQQMPRLGEPVPAFEAMTTKGKISFPDDYKGKWVILFSHPADFTPICTTEILTFGARTEEFRALNCELVGLSVDSRNSHIAWLKTIREKIEYKGMKDVKVGFPIIDDVAMKVASLYGMIQPGESQTAAVRAVFFVDPKGVLRAMIYYPLAALLQAGIRDILIIIPPGEEGPFYRLLGSGGRFGVNITYEVQEVARGIADALLIGSQFIGDDSVCLVLGDNIFYSPNFQNYLDRAVQQKSGACVFGYYVDDPRAFGVVEFDGQGRAISIEEKPRYPKSNYIIPGLYFYDNSVMEIARGLKPSARGELEITDVNIEYMKRGQLHVEKLDRDFVWLDAGTADNLLESAQVVRRVQDETGRYIACPEEIAYARGYISRQTLLRHAADLSKTLYGRYLECL